MDQLKVLVSYKMLTVFPKEGGSKVVQHHVLVTSQPAFNEMTDRLIQNNVDFSVIVVTDEVQS